MEYKRLNLRVPMDLYLKIKEYCDSVGSPVGSGMCMLCDAQINALRATELMAIHQTQIDDLRSLIVDAKELKDVGKI